MTLTTNINRLKSDTASGYHLKLTFHYTSFDKKEIDAVEKLLRETYHNNSIIEYNPLDIMADKEIVGNPDRLEGGD